MQQIEKILKTAVQALSDKKAQDIQILRIEEITTLADYFVICTGSSNTHIKALRDETDHQLKAIGADAHHVEGHGGGAWVLMDYSSVVIHIFTEEARKFYQLDRVWADAEVIELNTLGIS